MAYIGSTPRQRSASAAGAVALTAMLAAMIAWGLATRAVHKNDASLFVFEPAVEPAPPKREPKSRERRSPRPEGEAAPPNLRVEPTEIVAPPTPQLQPPPLAAAPIAGIGVASSAGSAEVSGPGTGAGGEGNGRGSGGDGDGDGGGGGEGTPPRQVRGSLRDSDFPEEAADAGAGGTVGVRYLVEVDGRVSECDVTRSSGSALLDATTCRLIRQRFRFRPSRDERGRPVPAWLVENHEWVLQIEKSAEPERRKRRVRIF